MYYLISIELIFFITYEIYIMVLSKYNILVDSLELSIDIISIGIVELSIDINQLN